MAASVIPERRETFRVVLRTVLQEQTQPIDRFDVYLKGMTGIPSGYPVDPRIRFLVDYAESGPWSRYLTADGLEGSDVLVTVDDDMEYPPGFVQRGLAALQRLGRGTSVSFGGILWDPLADAHGFTENCWRFHTGMPTCRERAVAFPMGGASFFRAESVRGAVHFPLPGFQTNDDMMIAHAVQTRGERIVALEKPRGWIRDLPAAAGRSALFRRDAATRHATFRDLVRKLGFDPTAGELGRYLENPRRVLVIADSLPPLAGTDDLHRRLLALCDDGAGVHAMAPVPASRIPDVMFRPNAPYEVHAVAVPEPGGRLNSLPPVRAWRNWRVDRARQRKWALRERLARERLQPTEVFRWVGGRLQPEVAGE